VNKKEEENWRTLQRDRAVFDDAQTGSLQKKHCTGKKEGGVKQKRGERIPGRKKVGMPGCWIACRFDGNAEPPPNPPTRTHKKKKKKTHPKPQNKKKKEKTTTEEMLYETHGRRRLKRKPTDCRWEMQWAPK